MKCVCAKNNCSETQPLLHQHCRKLEHQPKPRNAKCHSRKTNCRIILVRGKGPIIFIIWNALMALSTCIQVVYMMERSVCQILLGFIAILCFPVIGWLADVKVGRYRIMQASLLLFFISNAIEIITTLGKNLISNATCDSLFYAGSFVLYLALSCYTSSFLQFVTDQQVDASSEELSFTIY